MKSLDHTALQQYRLRDDISDDTEGDDDEELRVVPPKEDSERRLAEHEFAPLEVDGAEQAPALVRRIAYLTGFEEHLRRPLLRRISESTTTLEIRAIALPHRAETPWADLAII